MKKPSTLKRSLGLFGMAAGIAGLAMAALPEEASAQKKFEGVELVVATFPSTWEIRFREEVGPAMEAMGVKLKFIGGRSEEFLAKMIAAKGSPTFDVVEITDHVSRDMLKSGFLEKLNLDNIPNTKFLNPAMYDDYKVGYWSTQAAFIWNWKKFEELGIPHPTEIEDLLHPKLKGKVIFSTLSSYIAIPHVVALATKYGGSEADLDPALPVIRKFVDHVHSFADFTPMSQAMKNGDIYAAVSVANGAIRILDAGVPIAVRHITIKGKTGVPNTGWLGMVKGTKHPEVVEAFINETIGWEMQEGEHLNNGIVPTNKEVLAKHAKQQRKDQFGTYFNMMEPEMVDNMYYIDFSKIDRAALGKKLLRVQAGK